MEKAVKDAKEWQEAQQILERPHQTKRPRTRPTTNDPRYVYCYTDASWKKETRATGLGWIFTDSNNKILGRGSKGLQPTRSPLMAEASAILEALSEARNRGWQRIVISSDSQNVINAITKRKPPQEVYGIINDIIDLSLQFVDVNFKSVARKNNYVADTLAKEACRNIAPRCNPNSEL